MHEENNDATVKQTLGGIGIPSEVLYNPLLSQTEKILFGFIQNHDKTSRGCWATNSYFAQLMFVGNQTISNAIGKFLDLQYITVEYVKPNKLSNMQERRIRENPKYKELYRPLVIAMNDNVHKKNYTSLLKILYTHIKNILYPYKEIYNKYINEEINELIMISSKEEISDDESSPSIPPESNDDYKEVQSSKPYKLNKLQHSLKSRRERVRHQSYIDQWTEIRVPEHQEELRQARAKDNHLKDREARLEAATKVEQGLQDNIALLIEHWNTLDLKPVDVKKAPKNYIETVKSLRKLLKGTLIPGQQKFTEDRIKEVMVTFSMAALDDDFEPSNPEYKRRLAKMSLNEFLYNPNARRYTSLFLKYNEDGIESSKKQQERIEDPNPSITNKIRRFYLNYALGGVKGANLKESEENKFRLATKQILDFYQKNKYRIQGLDGGTPELADFLCDAIKDQYGDNIEKVYPGSFCSSAALSCLIKRLNAEGMIEESQSAYELYGADPEMYRNKSPRTETPDVPEVDDEQEEYERKAVSTNVNDGPYGNGDPDWYALLTPEKRAELP